MSRGDAERGFASGGAGQGAGALVAAAACAAFALVGAGARPQSGRPTARPPFPREIVHALAPVTVWAPVPAVSAPGVNDAGTASARERAASYLAYEASADAGDAGFLHGTLDYGIAIGPGVGTVQLAAESSAEGRRLALRLPSWERYDARGAALRIGDATMVRQGFEQPARFEGVQWSSNSANPERLRAGVSVLSYEAGVERSDAGIASVRFGAPLVSATLARGVAPDFTERLHLYHQDATTLAAISGSWRLRDGTELRIGLAPNTATRLLATVGLRGRIRNIEAKIDARINGEPRAGLGARAEPAFGHDLTARIGLHPTSASTLALTYGEELHPSLIAPSSSHTIALHYETEVGGKQLAIDRGAATTNGVTTQTFNSTATLALDRQRALLLSEDASGARTLELQKNLVPAENGLGYDLRFAGGSAASHDAALTWQAPGTVAHLDLSRTQGPEALHADVSGSVVFFGGTHAVAARITQRNALGTLRRQRVLTLRLVGLRGAPLPAGSVVHSTGGSSSGNTDADGRVALTGLDAGDVTLHVTLAGGVCSVAIVVPVNLRVSNDLGTRVCR